MSLTKDECLRYIKNSPNARIVLVTGDRNWEPVELMYGVLSDFTDRPTVIVHGAARGVDLTAHVVAEELGLLPVPNPAHWAHSDSCPDDCQEVCGRAAGAIRNRMMYTVYRPHLVLGFHRSIRDSKGTLDMLKFTMSKGGFGFLYDGVSKRALSELKLK